MVGIFTRLKFNGSKNRSMTSSTKTIKPLESTRKYNSPPYPSKRAEEGLIPLWSDPREIGLLSACIVNALDLPPHDLTKNVNKGRVAAIKLAIWLNHALI